jgi:hypothetical protein
MDAELPTKANLVRVRDAKPWVFAMMVGRGKIARLLKR